MSDRARSGSSGSALVLDLARPEALDPARVGGKAANLARLTAAGFPVPKGFTVTADAYHLFAREGDLHAAIARRLDAARDPESIERESAAVRGLVGARPVPGPVAAAIRSAYTGLGEGELAVAVRSSATAEDLAEASFAGQQDTFLNVRGAEALLEHVRQCWASLWSARAVTYRQKHGVPAGDVAIAVVVQCMVPADVAGVMFTANPVSGRHDETVINASFGLGESVVSGRVTPDTYVVEPRTGRVRDRRIAAKTVEIVAGRDGTRERHVAPARAGRAALDDQALRNLAWLGARIAAEYGAPQDIEWAVAGDQMFVLQARPITTMSPRPDCAPEDHWTRAIFVELLPDAPSPVFCSVLVPILTGMLDFTFRSLGMRPPQAIPGVAVFYHQPYLNLRYIRAALSDLPPARAEALAGRIANPFGEPAPDAAQRQDPSPHAGRRPRPSAGRGRRLPAVSELRLAYGLVRAANRVPRELPRVVQRYYAALEPLPTTDPRHASDEEVIRQVHRVAHAVLPQLVAWDFLLIATLGFVLRLVDGIVRRSGLADPERLTGVLRSGLTGNVTMESNKALWRLKELAAAEPEVARAIAEAPDGVLAQRVAAAAGDGPFARALADVLARFGHREVRMDIVDPSWREDPTPVLRFVRAYLAAGAAPSPSDQEQRLAEARRLTSQEVERALRRTLAGRLVLAPVFRWSMARAEALGAERDSMHFHWTASFPHLRRWLLALGERWAAAGVVTRADDVYCLSVEELLAWLEHRGPLGERAARNRSDWARDRRRAWPIEIAAGEEVYTEAPPLAGAPAGSGQVLNGVAGSPGVVSGAVRVVRGPEEFGRIQAGEILVAPYTNPVWTPLFAIAGGIVTDTGGILSHGAIVAREYGLPAVMGVAGASARLIDGQTVTVDGTRGLVILAGS